MNFCDHFGIIFTSCKNKREIMSNLVGKSLTMSIILTKLFQKKTHQNPCKKILIYTPKICKLTRISVASFKLVSYSTEEIPLGIISVLFLGIRNQISVKKSYVLTKKCFVFLCCVAQIFCIYIALVFISTFIELYC